MLKSYAIYLLRWQLSTPLLSGGLWLLSDLDVMTATIAVNFFGGLIFFWIDKFIFSTSKSENKNNKFRENKIKLGGKSQKPKEEKPNVKMVPQKNY